MSIEICILKAKELAESFSASNRQKVLINLGEMAEILNGEVSDNKQWNEEEIKRLNGLLKYVILATENGDYQFGVEVVSSSLIPLLKGVSLKTDQSSESLDFNIDIITSNIKEQYKDFPYPNFWKGVIPEEIKRLDAKKNTVNAMHNLEYIQHIAFKKMNTLENLKVMVAGCGTGESSIAAAIIYPQVTYTYVDISPTSLSYARKYAKELGIKNIVFIHDDIMTMNLNKEFDVIVSTGVIHHLSEPSKGVNNLKRHLKVNGVLCGMVYGEYGRFEIGLFQDIIKTILPDNGDFEKSIPLAKMLLNEFDENNRNLNELSWKDVFRGDQHIVDLLLNVNEYRYNVKTLDRMLDDGGLRIIAFTNEATLNPDNYVKSDILKNEFSKLSYLDRCSVAEQIYGKLMKHHFLAVKKENSFIPLSINDEKYLEYTVHKSPYLELKRIETSVNKESIVCLNRKYLYEDRFLEDEGIKIDKEAVEMLEFCNGKHKIKYILDKMINKINIEIAKQFLEEAIKRKYLFLHE